MPRSLSSTIRAVPAYGRRVVTAPRQVDRQAMAIEEMGRRIDEMGRRVEALEHLVEQFHAQLTAVDPGSTHEIVLAVRESVEQLGIEVTEHLNRAAASVAHGDR